MFLRFETISRLPLVMRGKGETAAAMHESRQLTAASRSHSQTTADARPPLGSAGFSFNDSALAPATGAESATAPDLSDPSDAVAANSISASAETCGGAESRSAALRTTELGLGRVVPSPSEKPIAGVASGPQDSISVSSVSAEGVATVAPEETPVPVAAVASNSELAEGPVVAPRQTESFAARLLGPGRKKGQAFLGNGGITPIGPRGDRFSESRCAGSPLSRASAHVHSRSTPVSHASIQLPTNAALESFKITQAAIDVLFPVFALLFVQLCAFAVVVFIIRFFMR